MTLTRPPVLDTRTPGSPARSASISGRDTTIDAVRAGCLLVVVVLHALMVGIWVGPDGGLNTAVALAGETWFVPATWALQVMPLFFIAGGFVSLMQWRRMRARGASAGEYIAGRVRRLAAPAAVMTATVGLALLAARMTGADPELLAEAGLRIGQPLWFLAVYFGVTALVPVMARLHERRPLLTVAGLGAAVLIVDLAGGRGASPLGYLNLALVWPLMQQIGFAMLDGACAGWSRRHLLAGLLTACAGLFVLIALGWSPDMLVNLNPPTTAIVLLGAGQFFGLMLLRPCLGALTSRPTTARVAERASAWAMGVYLWHMPLILALAAGLWAVGIPLPEPHTAAWWATRVPWLVAILALVVPFASGIVRLDQPVIRLAAAVSGRLRAGERGPGLLAPTGVLVTAAVGTAAAVLGTAAAVLGTAAALLVGLDEPLVALVATALLGGAVVLAPAARVSPFPPILLRPSERSMGAPRPLRA